MLPHEVSTSENACLTSVHLAAIVQGKYFTFDETIYLLQHMDKKGKSRRGFPFADIAAEAGTCLGGRGGVRIVFMLVSGCILCVTQCP